MINQRTSPRYTKPRKSFRLLESLKIKQPGNQTGRANVKIFRASPKEKPCDGLKEKELLRWTTIVMIVSNVPYLRSVRKKRRLL